jgi:hypothetical protein
MRTMLLLLLAACGVEADSKPASLSDAVRGVAQRMHARYAAVQQIEQGIVASRLEEVHAAARSIASLDEPDVLPTWQPYFQAVQAAARDLEAADDTVAAARLTGELGRRCAACHQAIGARIVFRGSPKPDVGPHLAATMAAHHWAVARMWEGVIGPNDERWNTGAKLLQHAPLTFVAESGELGIADDVVLIRLYARRAVEMKSNAERAELFGQLLGTCARCHATIRDDAR